ncbi:hypothetical protein BKA64DRAFT_239387 [Cadophora sp. MPI-SDFR-AT-0126]|nr:hypothetical protein BKA64DRAFT_239387 [Leotiomycetes sp. MPI-SDFR-AT-0126]
MVVCRRSHGSLNTVALQFVMTPSKRCFGILPSGCHLIATGLRSNQRSSLSKLFQLRGNAGPNSNGCQVEIAGTSHLLEGDTFLTRYILAMPTSSTLFVFPLAEAVAPVRSKGLGKVVHCSIFVSEFVSRRNDVDPRSPCSRLVWFLRISLFAFRKSFFCLTSEASINIEGMNSFTSLIHNEVSPELPTVSNIHVVLSLGSRGYTRTEIKIRNRKNSLELCFLFRRPINCFDPGFWVGRLSLSLSTMNSIVELKLI